MEKNTVEQTTVVITETTREVEWSTETESGTVKTPEYTGTVTTEVVADSGDE